MNRTDGVRPDTAVTAMRLSYEELRQTLRQFEYFRHWSDEQVRECSILAQVVQYEPQQTIPLEGALPFAYLVLSGQCMILQCLRVVRHVGLERERLQLLRDDPSPVPVCTRDLEPSPLEQLEQIHQWHATFSSRVAESVAPTDEEDTKLPYDPDGAIAYVQTPPPERRTVHHFLDVGTFRCGAVFGLGECHQDRTIVARSCTQCLRIPRCWLFLKRQNVGNTWQRLRMYLDWQLPTRDALFGRFLREREWRRYRRRLARNAPKRPTWTQPADVPVICRLAESTHSASSQGRP